MVAAQVAVPRETRGRSRLSLGEIPEDRETHGNRIRADIKTIRETFGPSKERDSRAIEFSTLAPFLRSVEAWTQATHTTDAPTRTEKAITRIEAVADKLEKHTKEDGGKQLLASYANALRKGGAGGTQQVDKTITEPSKEDPKEQTQILIKIMDKPEAEEIKGISNEEIIARASRDDSESTATRNIIAARKLPSGDILIYTDSVEGKRRLEKEQGWEKKICPTAEIRQKSYQVIIHGLRVMDFPRDEGAANAKNLEEQNAGLHPEMKIKKMEWLRKVEGIKDYSSMVIEVNCAKTANRMISQGVVHRYDLKTVEYYERKSRITQCFNCQKYGHISIRCKDSKKCGYCGDNHTTEKCQKKEDAESRRCAACTGGQHPSWSSTCPARKKEVERAREAYRRRPRFHPIPEEPHQQYTTESLQASSQATNMRNNSVNKDHPWIMVEGGKKRKLLEKTKQAGTVGRPKKILTDTSSQNIRDLMGSGQQRRRSASETPASRERDEDMEQLSDDTDKDL